MARIWVARSQGFNKLDRTPLDQLGIINIIKIASFIMHLSSITIYKFMSITVAKLKNKLI